MPSAFHARGTLVLGALQGPNTFGADAARRFIELYPEHFGDVVYYDTSEEALSFRDGRADAICPPQQMTRTGFHPEMQAYIARPDSALYVLGEVQHAYRCSLLGKPGTPLERIRRVLGHTGSVTQSRAWLDLHLPQSEITIVKTSSMDAAQAAADSDGSVASIGTAGMAQELGLAELERDVDGGSVGSYWAVSPKALFSDAPGRVVVAGRFHDDGALTDAICGLADVGFRLETVFDRATGSRLFEYDYVLRFRGAGRLADVRAAVERVSGARLAGAFEVKD